jgi:phosphoribosylaminoimidazolecarboxamide formyltransferase/IMP cyclohydrolase
LLDVDAAVNLINVKKTTVLHLLYFKHNNACGLASRDSISEAYIAALHVIQHLLLVVLIANTKIDVATAIEINFFVKW